MKERMRQVKEIEKQRRELMSRQRHWNMKFNLILLLNTLIKRWSDLQLWLVSIYLSVESSHGCLFLDAELVNIDLLSGKESA
jgi:hypothetical protein